MAGVAGVEPTSAVLETVILPLNYTPIFLKARLHYIIQTSFIQLFLCFSYNNLGDIMIVNYTDNERDLLARLMRAEAVGEGDLGMLMVGNVVVNRTIANCLTFKNINSISQAIYQSPGGFAGVNSPLFFSSPSTHERELADRVLQGEYYYPATNALWFYAPASGQSCRTTWWEQPLSGRYKNHCFYEPQPGECNELH